MKNTAKFDPDRHCGADHNGEPCKQLKGYRTDHIGEGRCWQHGGLSTGPRTEDGKARSAQNARVHGLYANVLSGGDRVRFDLVRSYDPAEILRDNFFLIQSRVLGLMENEGKFSRDAQVLKQACEMLVEQGELSEEFANEVMMKLAHLDVERLSRVLNSTVNLANGATFLDRMGDVRRQLTITLNYMRHILRSTSERAVKELVITAFQELKLEAGLPVDEIQELLELFKVEAEAQAEALENGDDPLDGLEDEDELEDELEDEPENEAAIADAETVESEPVETEVVESEPVGDDADPDGILSDAIVPDLSDEDDFSDPLAEEPGEE